VHLCAFNRKNALQPRGGDVWLFSTQAQDSYDRGKIKGRDAGRDAPEQIFSCDNRPVGQCPYEGICFPNEMTGATPFRNFPRAGANHTLQKRVAYPSELIAREHDQQIDRNAQRNSVCEMWRTFATPVTFFDLCSPRNFLAIEIREFFRKWRARRDSNAGPPA
jgi:hypothetical protein